MMKSLFITFEGPEGAGKTTVLKKIAEKYMEQQVSVLTTREPGGSVIAEKIREVILDKAHVEMDPRTEALLYAAARSQHFVEKVAPALAEGKLVLCDRFIDSSLAYQGVGRQLGIDAVKAINEFGIGQRLPDKTILFDLDPEVGLARIAANKGREVNRLDEEGLAFHKQVRAAYVQLAEKYPERIQLINANQPVERVVEDVWNCLQTLS